MKRFIISFVVFLLIIIITFLYRQLKWDNLIDEIQLNYKSEAVQEIENYSLEVSESKAKKFPSKAEKKAILVRNNLLRTTKNLDELDVKNIISLLNDSSSYRCGEIGTPHFDIDIFYFDENDKTVGVTLFSYDRQTYSYPHIPLMKWGMLQDDAFSKLSKILSKY